MNSEKSVSQLLERLLPKTLDLPCNDEGKVDFVGPEIGLLSMREFSITKLTHWGYGDRSPFQQIPGMNPLREVQKWEDLNEHYLALREEAIDGCDQALNDLGWLWLNTRDETFRALASQVLQLAANRGNLNAVYNLAEQSLEGRGVPTNLPRAIELYEQASADFHEASLKLGMLYEFGRDDLPDLEIDLAKAMKWYRKGNTDACCWGCYHMSCLALKETSADYNPGNAIYELQNLAVLKNSKVALSASEQLMHYYRCAGLPGDYQALYVFWRDYAIEQDSYWAKELKQQDSMSLMLRITATKPELKLVTSPPLHSIAIGPQ